MVPPIRRAHRAVRAVAADHRRGPDGTVRTAVPVREGHGHPVVVLLQAGHLDAALDGDPRIGVRGLRQHGLEVGLVHERALRPAVQAGVGGSAELREHPMAAVEQPQTGHGPAAGEHLLGHPGRLQRAEHLAVEVHGPRELIGLPVPLHDMDHQAAGGQQQRRRHTDRSGAHDDDRSSAHGTSVIGGPSSHSVRPDRRNVARHVDARGGNVAVVFPRCDARHTVQPSHARSRMPPRPSTSRATRRF